MNALLFMKQSTEHFLSEYIYTGLKGSHQI